MQEAVRRHDAILRDAITEHGGQVFKTIGDAFCSTFERPESAVAAMLVAQCRLAAENFSSVDGLRVRTAIHSGTADAREGDYFGPAVNKVARLLAIVTAVRSCRLPRRPSSSMARYRKKCRCAILARIISKTLLSRNACISC